MDRSGSSFYDDEAVFATYMRHRHRLDTPNETLEKPIILELVNPIAGKRILDLGCGDATVGKEFLYQGATSYTGVEGSHKMVEAAIQSLTGTSGKVIRQTIEDWIYPPTAFDLVLARLALHYVADLSLVFANVFQTLVAGGQFVFSVEHPVITSCNRGWIDGTLRQDWVVDDYFSTGLRVVNWLGGTVQKYHRTIEDYFCLLQTTGFQIEELREAQPKRDYFYDTQTYERRKRVPLFLILSARKPM
jgi:SAM-dependent methyltransferase